MPSAVRATHGRERSRGAPEGRSRRGAVWSSEATDARGGVACVRERQRRESGSTIKRWSGDCCDAARRVWRATDGALLSYEKSGVRA
jgi:hypothetical protein